VYCTLALACANGKIQGTANFEFVFPDMPSCYPYKLSTEHGACAAGVVAQVTVAICGNNSSSNRFYSEWYCQRQSMGRSIITSILPTVLLMLWQNLFMPNALYRCARAGPPAYNLSLFITLISLDNCKLHLHPSLRPPHALAKPLHSNAQSPLPVRAALLL
jgi:hypothetical protein